MGVNSYVVLEDQDSQQDFLQAAIEVHAYFEHGEHFEGYFHVAYSA